MCNNAILSVQQCNTTNAIMQYYQCNNAILSVQQCNTTSAMQTYRQDWNAFSAQVCELQTTSMQIFTATEKFRATQHKPNAIECQIAAPPHLPPSNTITASTMHLSLVRAVNNNQFVSLSSQNKAYCSSILQYCNISILQCV